MIIDSDGMKPIYVQIAEWLENEILNDHVQTDEKIYSQYQLADMYTINPATAAKGLSLLAEENTLYKKRGLGMYVSPGAKEKILDKRKNETLRKMIMETVTEAERLHISEEDLLNQVTSVYKQMKGELK